jgi:putative hydrolase
VSNPSPFGGGGNFFEGLFGDLLKLLRTEGPINWELTRQLAQAVATGGEAEPNVDPVARIRLEELLRVAELHVADATGLATSASGATLTVNPVGRAQWAWFTLEDWRSLIEAMARSLSPKEGLPKEGDVTAEETRPDLPGGEPLGGEADLSDLLGQWASALGPTLLGMQFGSTVGHLAQKAMGQYDLPIPRPPRDQLLVVPSNLESFSKDWSLPQDDVRLWVCIGEIAHHAVLSRPGVRERLQGLLHDYVSGFRPDSTSFEDKLSGLDPSDPAALQRAIGDPTALLGEAQTDEQRALLAQMEAIVSVLEGYVDNVLDTVGRRLISSYGPLSEALRRRRVERDQGQRFVERLFGLEMGQEQFDRGSAFVEGVIERAGEKGLVPLWKTADHLPTPAEVDAPGLWLERIGFLEDGPAS